jgi:hypothetical protein
MRILKFSLSVKKSLFVLHEDGRRYSLGTLLLTDDLLPVVKPHLVDFWITKGAVNEQNTAND